MNLELVAILIIVGGACLGGFIYQHRDKHQQGG